MARLSRQNSMADGWCPRIWGTHVTFWVSIVKRTSVKHRGHISDMYVTRLATSWNYSKLSVASKLMVFRSCFVVSAFPTWQCLDFVLGSAWQCVLHLGLVTNKWSSPENAALPMQLMDVLCWPRLHPAPLQPWPLASVAIAFWTPRLVYSLRTNGVNAGDLRHYISFETGITHS